MNLKSKNLFLFAIINVASACKWSPTTVSGSKAPNQICSGDLIFEDNFDWLDQSKWKHANTLSGGGNNEFQWYVNDRRNSYTWGGNLHIKPTLTSEAFDENFVTNGHIKIPGNECTESWSWGCERSGGDGHIINPIRSAKLDTSSSFSFKYGTIEFRAKNPGGDWLWPALWMMPKKSVYGGWPASGEIDIMESRGNRFFYWDNKYHIGTEQVGSTVHFGPSATVKNQWPLAHFTKNRVPGYNEDFHLFKLEWSQTQMKFFVDNEHIGTDDAGTGFWNMGGFQSSGLPNPWAGASNMAPFDQEFYIIMNLAVGGTNYFDDSATNRHHPKPWKNNAARPARDFLNARSDWEPTWNRNNDDGHLIIDYVRVWAS